MELLSFKNDTSVKESLIQRMQHHYELDEIVKGATGQDGKGCTVWCALNNGELKRGYDHSAFPDVLGLPEWLAQLQDTIFEGLDTEDAKTFSLAWPKAIPVGRNLEPVKWKLCAFLMQENIERVLQLDIADDLKKQVVDAIQGVLNVHLKAVDTGMWDDSAAESAARSAAGSAESAAWSAAGSAAGSAAWSAAWSADSAWSAARSAESAARSAESAARSAAYKKYADKLLELLAAA